MGTESLHQELILQHFRRPRNRGRLDAPDVEAQALNPLCGDEVRLQLRMRDGRIEAARFRGQGCSISQASASMMAQLLEGRSLAEAEALAARFTEMLHGSADAAGDRALGDLRALAGVSRFPARVRCALLAWDALRDAEQRLRAGDGGPQAAG